MILLVMIIGKQGDAYKRGNKREGGQVMQRRQKGEVNLERLMGSQNKLQVETSDRGIGKGR